MSVQVADDKAVSVRLGDVRSPLRCSVRGAEVYTSLWSKSTCTALRPRCAITYGSSQGTKSCAWHCWPVCASFRLVQAFYAVYFPRDTTKMAAPIIHFAGKIARIRQTSYSGVHDDREHISLVLMFLPLAVAMVALGWPQHACAGCRRSGDRHGNDAA